MKLVAFILLLAVSATLAVPKAWWDVGEEEPHQDADVDTRTSEEKSEDDLLSLKSEADNEYADTETGPNLQDQDETVKDSAEEEKSGQLPEEDFEEVIQISEKTDDDSMEEDSDDKKVTPKSLVLDPRNNWFEKPLKSFAARSEDENQDENENTNLEDVPMTSEEADPLPEDEDSVDETEDEIDDRKEDPAAIPEMTGGPILCEEQNRLFTLMMLPKAENLFKENASSVEFTCHLNPINETIEVPALILVWKFEKYNCSAEDLSNDQCTEILQQDRFNDSTSFKSAYSRSKVSHTHAGKYTCMAIIETCDKPEANHTEVAINLRVYKRPNYGTHIAVVSTASILLLVILLGLFTYTRRIHNRSQNRYRELLSSADITYNKSEKVLELPNTAVYNPTTIRVSEASFGSRSSFNSEEDV